MRQLAAGIVWLFVLTPLGAQTPLPSGTKRNAHLSGAQTAEYTIAATPGNYVRLTATASGTTVEITLLDAAGAKLASTSSAGGSGAPAEVAAIASSSSLLARVRLPRRDAELVDITVALRANRAATEADRSDAAAFAAYTRALDPKQKANAEAAFDEAGRLGSASNDDWLRTAAAISRTLANLSARAFDKAVQTAHTGAAAATYDAARGLLFYLQAIAHLQHEQAAEAIPLFERAAEVQRAREQKFELGSSLHNLSVARWLVGDCSAALADARGALALRRDTQDRSREAYSLLAIAKDYFCLGDAQHALDTYSEVEPLWRELKDDANLAAPRSGPLRDASLGATDVGAAREPLGLRRHLRRPRRGARLPPADR